MFSRLIDLRSHPHKRRSRLKMVHAYAGLEWLTPPSAGGTNVLIATLLVSALAFALGRVSRTHHSSIVATRNSAASGERSTETF